MIKDVLLYFVLTLLFASCGKEVDNVNYAIFSGQILNAEEPEITLVGNRYSRIRKSIELNEDGSFTDTLKLKEWNTDYSVYFPGKSKINMYVSAGDHIQLIADLTDLDSTIQWEGNTLVIQEYLKAKSDLEKNFLPENERLWHYNEEKFMTENQGLKIDKLALLNNTPELPDDFRNREKKEIEYDYLINLAQYPFHHGRHLNNRDFKVSDNYAKDLETFNYDNEKEFFASYRYKELVYTKLRNVNAAKRRQLRAQNIDPDKDKTLWFQAIEENIKNDKLKQYLFSSSLEETLLYETDLNLVKQAYDFAYPLLTDDSVQAKMDTLYTKKMKMAPGNPSPVFVSYDNHNGSKTSLADLKGKYVYIDLWATWCGPCKKEFPFLKKVEKMYHDKNIQFVGISVDEEKDFDKWKKMVDDLELDGTQLFADKSFKSDFVKSYGVKGIPHYILLDPEGNIVSVDAPRPSSDKLIELFDSLNL